MARSPSRLTGLTPRNEQGSTAIMVAVMLVVLIGFVSFVVDVGYMFRVRNELQNAADSAALAGALELDRQVSGLTAACSKAKQFSATHYGDNSAVHVADGDVHLGHWYFQAAENPPCGTAPCFRSLGTCASLPDEDVAKTITAVRVTARRDSTANEVPNNSPVKLFFGVFLGRAQTDVGASAIAVGGGGPFRACSFPVALLSCAVKDEDGEPTCPEQMCFGGSCKPSNSVLTNLSEYKDPPVNGNGVHPLVVAALNGDCGPVTVTAGSDIQLQAGNDLNKDSINLINEKLQLGPIFVDVPVIDWPDCSKPNPTNQTRPVNGFMRIQIIGANWTSGDPKKAILATAVCNQESPGPAGSDYFGLSAYRPWLVK